MGKTLLWFVLTSVTAVALTAYLTYDPIPNFLLDQYGLRLILVKAKTLMFLGRMLGYSDISVSRSVYSYVLGDRSYLRDREEEIKTVDTEIAGVNVRIYKPRDRAKLAPAFVYIHGGRWSLLGIDDYDSVVAHQVLKLKMIGISVGYRLAPESPFPAGFNDCLSVTRYVLQHGVKHGINTSRVVLAGDDAGGNMAAAVAIRLRDEHVTPGLKSQVLIYPSLTFCSFHGPSYQSVEAGEGGNISANTHALAICEWQNFTANQRVALFSQCFTPKFINRCGKFSNPDYLDESLIPEYYKTFEYPVCNITEDVEIVSERLMDPLVAPALEEDLDGLPHTLILTTALDILRDDGGIYARRLKWAGVPFHWVHLSDSYHWIFNFFYDKRYTNGMQSHRLVTEYMRKYV